MSANIIKRVFKILNKQSIWKYGGNQIQLLDHIYKALQCSGRVFFSSAPLFSDGLQIL